MAEIPVLKVKKRQVLGKSWRRQADSSLVPANIVSSKKPSLAIEVARQPLDRVLKTVGYTQPVNLDVAGQKKVVLVTEVNFWPTRNDYQHVVFQEVAAGQTVTVNVPLVTVGEAPGILLGLLLIQMVYSVELTADALKLPEQVEIDVSQLNEDGQVLRASSLVLPVGTTSSIEPETPLVRLEKSRAAVAKAEAESKEEETETEDGQEAEGEAADGSEETQK